MAVLLTFTGSSGTSAALPVPTAASAGSVLLIGETTAVGMDGGTGAIIAAAGGDDGSARASLKRPVDSSSTALQPSADSRRSLSMETFGL